MTDIKAMVEAEFKRLNEHIAELELNSMRYEFLRSLVVYEGSSDWVINVWGRFATFEEAMDAAMNDKNSWAYKDKP